MVKASLRSSARKAIVVDAEPVEVNGVKVESKTTVGAAPQGDLTNIIPGGEPENPNRPVAPPVDNAHVAPGCEQFAVTRRPSSSIAVPRHFEGSGLDGDFGAEDLKFPQLKMVQGSGALSAEFDTGTVIYGESELFAPFSVKADAKNPVLRFVPISLLKQYREKLSKEAVDAGEMPRIANSVAEVEDMGGTTRWVGNSMPDNYWEASSRCLLLIEEPEGTDNPGFTHEINGKNYGVAAFYAAGGAYRNFTKVIFNTALTSLLVPVPDGNGGFQKSPSGQIIKRPLLSKNFWTLTFERKSNDQHSWWTPKCRLIAKEETSPEIRAYCESLVSGSAGSAEE